MGNMLIGRSLDGSWPEWLKENIGRQCNPEELLGVLLKNGFSVDSIRQHMGEHFPAHSVLLTMGADIHTSEGISYTAIANVRLTRPDTGLNVQQVVTNRLQLYVLENFLSEEECDRIVEIANTSLRPSTVTTGEIDKTYRTSNTCDLSLMNSAYIAKIDEKIARTLGVRIPYSEGMQAQRYDVGQEFKQHTDYFQPGTGEYSTFANDTGQRTWTFMIYLNEGCKGGGTKFFAIDKIIYPRKGAAVIWNSLYPNGTPNPDTLHSGMPVEEGHKIIITKWFRERGMGPMFYED